MWVNPPSRFSLVQSDYFVVPSFKYSQQISIYIYIHSSREHDTNAHGQLFTWIRIRLQTESGFLNHNYPLLYPTGRYCTSLPSCWFSTLHITFSKWWGNDEIARPVHGEITYRSLVIYHFWIQQGHRMKLYLNCRKSMAIYFASRWVPYTPSSLPIQLSFEKRLNVMNLVEEPRCMLLTGYSTAMVCSVNGGRLLNSADGKFGIQIFVTINTSQKF